MKEEIWAKEKEIKKTIKNMKETWKKEKVKEWKNEQ